MIWWIAGCAVIALLLYVGVEVYAVLVMKLGWSHDDWVDWAVATIAEQVFSDSP